MRGNILATENQQAIMNDVIEVKTGVYLHKTQIKTVKNNIEHAEFELRKIPETLTNLQIKEVPYLLIKLNNTIS